MMDALLASLPAYLLVFVRFSGMIGFNPLLSRRNVPAMVRAGLILGLTLLVAPTVQTAPGLADFTDLELLWGMFKELFIGFVCGFIFQLFYYMIFFAGDLMDVQFGLSMAKVFDPGTNIQTSSTGNFLSILFIFYLFSTNSHLLLIRIFASSFDVVPAGAVVITQNISGFIFDLFISVFSLAIRLSLPFIAAEFVLELAMGILMKLIPQIHVFVINIQFKLLLGIFLLLAFAGPIATFIDNYMDYMFENISQALFALA